MVLSKTRTAWNFALSAGLSATRSCAPVIRVFVALEQATGDGRDGAIAILEAPSLEASQIIELGPVGKDRAHDAASLVDESVVFQLGKVTSILDARGRILAFLPVDDRARVFDSDGAVAWLGNL